MNTVRFNEVFKEEIALINERRKNIGQAATPEADILNGGRNPDVNAGLFGLAFSGGGIRSAIFNFGVLQALAKRNILRLADYLSTVSGGGYIGSCLSSLLTNKKASVVWGEPFPFYFNRAENGNERDEVKHLRRNAQYLIPDGFMSYLIMIGHYLTGLVLSSLTPLSIGIILALGIHAAARQEDIPFKMLFLAAAGSLFALAVLVRGVLSLLREKKLAVRETFDGIVGFATVLFLAFGALAVLIVIAEEIPRFQAQARVLWSGLTAGSFLGLLSGLLKLQDKNLRKFVSLLFRASLILILPLLFSLLLYIFAKADFFDRHWGALLVVAGAALLASSFIKTNRISIHGFYRDRLSKTFIIKKDDEAKLVPNDRIKLRELHAHNNGPYQLIMCTLNIPSTKRLDVRGRKGDFFTFSQSYCGAESTGYKKTKEYFNGNYTLTTAMAVSGAAVASQMGKYSSPVLCFFLTLLNIRLNRWIPNPNNSAIKDRLMFRPYYFFKELFNRGSEKAWHLNVSDGGHLENSGLYPLIQRRCRYIILSDAGEDPGFQYKDLAESLRRIRIDFGVDIEMT
ncbi:MAG: hypothetical protein JXA71_02175 [Chitinispirillaceae bacterium]|nr:hypothetical protein [Chitinispirillaceae bacterium]